MASKMNSLMDERASAFEALVLQKLKASGVPDYKKLNGVSIRFSYGEDEGPFLTASAPVETIEE